MVLISNQQTSGLLQPFFWGGMERKSEKCHLPLGLIHWKWGTYGEPMTIFIFLGPMDRMGKDGVVMI